MYVRMTYLLVALCLIVSEGVFAKAWPEVRPISKKFEVMDSRHVFFTSLIQDKMGSAIYKLVCFPGGHTEHDFDYSGLVQCRLIDLAANAKNVDMLNQPNAGRDWLSRGKFEVAELTGNCAKDEYFGSKRVFFLRGMRIALQVDNFKEVQPEVEQTSYASYVLSFDVTNDKAAKMTSDKRVPLPIKSGMGLDCSNKEQWWDK